MSKQVRARAIRRGALYAMKKHGYNPRPRPPEPPPREPGPRLPWVIVVALAVALGISLFARRAHAAAALPDPSPTWGDLTVWAGLAFAVVAASLLLSEVALALVALYSKGKQ